VVKYSKDNKLSFTGINNLMPNICILLRTSKKNNSPNQSFQNTFFMNKFFTLIALLLSCATLLAQDATSIFKDRVGSTVVIITADKEGNPISQGSGFFIDKNLVATSHHVVAGAKQAIIKTIDGNTYDVEGYVADDAENDVVILKVDCDDGQPLEMATKNPEIGERVYVISTPKGLEASISDGLISGVRGDYEEGVTVVLQITAPVSHGSSGGAVLDKDGYLIGIVQGGKPEGQSLNFAVYVAYIKRLEQNRGFKRQLSALLPNLEDTPKSEETVVSTPPKKDTPKAKDDNEPNLAEYQSKALQKVYELENYLVKIGNKQTNAIDARNATDLAVSLFTSEDRTVEVSSTKRTTKNFYRIREYLNRMRTMPYDNVRVSWSNISYISNLRKGMDGNYYGIISFDQYFEGIKDGKVTYRDQTRKNVEVVLKSQNIYRNGESIPYWDVFLSDIGVVSTQ
jgi:hypothetical protein